MPYTALMHALSCPLTVIILAMSLQSSTLAARIEYSMFWISEDVCAHMRFSRIDLAI